MVDRNSKIRVGSVIRGFGTTYHIVTDVTHEVYFTISPPLRDPKGPESYWSMFHCESWLAENAVELIIT